MEKKLPYKRRVILIKKAFQFKYATIIVALFAISALIVWWELYQSMTGLYQHGMIEDPALMELLSQITQAVAIKLSVALIMVWALAIMLSHFIAGPIYRIEKSLGILKTGDLTHRIYLRKHDEMMSVAESFNNALDFLQESVKEDRVKLERSVRRLEEMNISTDVINDLKMVGKRFTI